MKTQQQIVFWNIESYPHAPPRLPLGSTCGGWWWSLKHTRQFLLVTFFHQTNFWFGPTDAPGSAPQPPGIGGDPKVIFFITEAYAATFISNFCWLCEVNFLWQKSDGWMDGWTDGRTGGRTDGQMDNTWSLK